MPWRPTRLLRVIESYDTSMGTTKIKTDATEGYIKALGNRQGPHALASELVASSLARWFGLRVPEFALFSLTEEACFDLPRGCRTQPGPAFVSRHFAGRTWAGSKVELAKLENPTDVTRLVVFDTWVRNCDRHPSDLATRKPNYANVYLANTDQPSHSLLVAIDHTHCFDGGRELSARLTEIGKVKDEATYGLFPAFEDLIDPGELIWCKAMLRTLTREEVSAVVTRIPREWQVDPQTAAALTELIHRRADFLAERLDGGWTPSRQPDTP